MKPIRTREVQYQFARRAEERIRENVKNRLEFIYKRRGD